MNELAVIIPMYNEEEGAERCVRAMLAAISSRAPGTGLFIVNDGSKDQTESVLTRLLNEGLSFKLVSHTPNRGYGGALVAGMKAAEEAGYIFGLMMDSDLTNDPNLIRDFHEKLKTGQFDLIKASRYVAGGKMEGVPFHRQLYSIVGNKVASLLFNMGIRDCTNGFHAVRLSMVTDGEFKERGFPFLLEELCHLKKKGARGGEFPYTLTSRSADLKPSMFTYTPEMLWSYFKYALKAAMY